MKLSIIIPTHNETENQLRPLFDSLNSQLSVENEDYEIIVCNDTDHGQDDIFEKYDKIYNKIRIYKVKARNNPGLSRQYGVDRANGDYILFCDADDMLYSCLSLSQILDQCDGSSDICGFSFLSEMVNENGTFYSIVKQNITWVFSKIYKREFLKKNNVRFSDKLLYHEDTYFNCYAYGCSPEMKFCEDIVYVWRYNAGSITRTNDGSYYYDSIVEHLSAITYAHDDLRSHFNAKDLPTEHTLSVKFFGNMYVKMHYNTENSTYKARKDEVESAFAEFVRHEDPEMCWKIPENRHIINDGIMMEMSMPDFAPDETFDAWMERILQGKEGEKSNEQS